MDEGAAASRQRAVDIDRALLELLGDLGGVAVVAVGGYGRGELAPHSDIDLLILTAPKAEVTQGTTRSLLYPLWDAGFQVGHAVRTPKEAIEQGRRDLDAATALLSCRFIGGQEELHSEVLDRRARWIRKDVKQIVRRIRESLVERHARVERAGWSLAPDIKDGVGGLRDLHTLGWIGTVIGDDRMPASLIAAGEVLGAVREALHAQVKRKTDQVRIDLQPSIADFLGIEGEDAPDVLMARVHSAARTVEFQATALIEGHVATVLGGPKRTGSASVLDHGVRLEDGALRLPVTAADPDPVGAMQLLAAHSSTGHPIDRRDLARLPSSFDGDPIETWVPEMKAAFRELIAGPNATRALELLEHLGAWPTILPEWSGVRGRPQHDPYHRYTVDGHSFLAVEEIARVIAGDPVGRVAAEEAEILGPLYVATLLHDVGKGSGEDHSVAGERLARAATRRMGLPESDIEHVASLVRHHLLLSDTATRRDLDDGAVIRDVADKVADPLRLRWLYLLSVADGRATGPEGWTDWKGALVAECYRKVLVALETGEIPARSDVAERATEVEAFEPSLAGRAEGVLATLPPSYLSSVGVPDMVDELRLLLPPPRSGEVRVRVERAPEADHDVVTVCVPDRPGTLARTAGVLALHRISVRRAQAYSTTSGSALERFIVAAPGAEAWDRFTEDLEAAYSGQLALDARLDRKVKDYLPERPVEASVEILQEESAHSTVVEVRAPDVLGLLYAITSGLSDLDLDIHVAKIDTLGERVVDVFYVRTQAGDRLGEAQGAEVRRAVEHRISRLSTP